MAAKNSSYSSNATATEFESFGGGVNSSWPLAEMGIGETHRLSYVFGE